MENWDKGNHSKYKPKEDHIAEMSKAMGGLCTMLAADSSEFENAEFFLKFGEYIKNNNNRLLYTNVTNFIFNDYNVVGTLQSNLDNVITYSYSVECKNAKEKSEHERIQRALMKLWDHINLAIRQYELFNQSDTHYETIAEEKMKNVEIRLTKEMNMQLISLMAIFTALSFLVFGGMNALDNIFLGVKDIPVTKLMIVGTIWCFCIMNLVFVFMFFIARLTGLNIKSTQDVNANLVQKYPLIWWCNLVLIAVLVSSCWAYYIKCEGFSVNIYGIVLRYPTLYFFSGTIAIISLIIWTAVRIYKLSKIKLKD